MIQVKEGTEALRIGGVLGLALSLAFPLIQKLLNDSKSMREDRRMRLYTYVLYFATVAILISASAWTFVHHPEVRSDDCKVSGTNKTSGSYSPIINCNSGVVNQSQDSHNSISPEDKGGSK